MCSGRTGLESERGRLVVLEGVDAAGKTTLSDDLFKALLSKDKPIQRFHFPGKTPGTLGELVYRIHHEHSDEFHVPSLSSCALQTLHIAAHVDAIESRIAPAVRDGAWVILDRFWWSTYVYGLDAGVLEQSLEYMIQLEKSIWGRLLPDVMFLVDTPTPLSSDESDTEAWQRKRQLYTELANRESESYRCVLIETERGQEARKAALERILHEVLR